MKKIWMVGLVVLISFALALPGSILAQERQEKVKEKVAAIKNLTPEQKTEIKNKLTATVEKLKNMTHEEKAQVKEAIGMFKELTPDQQKNLLKAIFKK